MEEFKSALINENYEQCIKLFDENVEKLEIFQHWIHGYLHRNDFILFKNFVNKYDIDKINFI